VVPTVSIFLGAPSSSTQTTAGPPPQTARARFSAKYPPSITYSLCTCGLNFAVLAGFELLSRRERRPFESPAWRAVLVYGRAPLFYYLLHIWARRAERLETKGSAHGHGRTGGFR